MKINNTTEYITGFCDKNLTLCWKFLRHLTKIKNQDDIATQKPSCLYKITIVLINWQFVQENWYLGVFISQITNKSLKMG